MPGQHHHHHDVAEEINQEHEHRLVINEEGLREFFPHESHGEKQHYNFSTTEEAIACAGMSISNNLLKQIQADIIHNKSIFNDAENAIRCGAKQTAMNIPIVCEKKIEMIKARVYLDDKKKNTIKVKAYCYLSAFDNRAVETEALSGVNAGMLSVYHHYKHIDPSLSYEAQLVFRKDEHRGIWISPQGIPEELEIVLTPPVQLLKGINTVIVSISDKALNGDIPDAGKLLQMRLEERGAKIVDYKLLSSKKKIITDYVKKIIEEKNPRLVILRGAVGVSRFDETPYATRAIIEDEIPGLATMLHVFGSRFTLGSWNARYQAGMVNKTLVISIPGARAAIDQLMYILPWLLRDTIDHMGETNLHSDHADPVEDFRMWA